MSENNERFRVVATKVNAWVKAQLAKLCKKKGLTEYEMLQMMCDCLVRYMDDRHNLSPELEQAISIFEHMEGWKGQFNIADPTAQHEVCEAVYIMADKAGKRHGFRAMMVRKPYMGAPDATYNIVSIFERMTEVLLPEIYRKLRMLAVDMDCNSIVDLLHRMIDAQDIERLNEEFRREFEDANRAENGKPYVYGARTKRKKTYSPDTMPGQQTIMFSPSDVPDMPEYNKPTSTEEMERDMGFRPHGGEW